MNQETTLDNRYNDENDIKKALSTGGFEKFYSKENGSILVKESDAVQVAIQLVNGTPVVTTKFPQIGNPIQIIVTILLVVLFGYLKFPSLVTWGGAIAGGQVISYGLLMPKILKLKKKVEEVF